MRSYMRNKATGEIRDVEADSAEFRELQGQVTSVGLPMWEQTHFPHAAAIKGRAEVDELLPEDLGTEHADQLKPEALKLHEEGIAPESNPHLALSPGEVEAGLTPLTKLQQLEEQFLDRVLGPRRRVFRDAAERIAGEGGVNPRDKVASTGTLMARAGGSDERANVPQVEASGDDQEAGDSDAGETAPARGRSGSRGATSGSGGSSGPSAGGQSAGPDVSQSAPGQRKADQPNGN